MAWRVIGPVAVVLVDGSARYMERGRAFSTGDNVDHLVSIGLIERVEEPVEPEPQSDGKADGDQGEAEAVKQATEDLQQRDLNELRALAAERKVDLAGATKKADIIAAIVAAA